MAEKHDDWFVEAALDEDRREALIRILQTRRSTYLFVCALGLIMAVAPIAVSREVSHAEVLAALTASFSFVMMTRCDTQLKLLKMLRKS